jgi:hypothetical protein
MQRLVINNFMTNVTNRPQLYQRVNKTTHLRWPTSELDAGLCKAGALFYSPADAAAARVLFTLFIHILFTRWFNL